MVPLEFIAPPYWNQFHEKKKLFWQGFVFKIKKGELLFDLKFVCFGIFPLKNLRILYAKKVQAFIVCRETAARGFLKYIKYVKKN